MRLNLKGLIFCAIFIIIANLDIFSQTDQNNIADTSRISGYLEKARKFSVKNELDSSIYYDKLLVNIYLSKKDTANAARVINFIAKLFQKKFEFDSALTYIKCGLKLFPQNSSNPASGKGELYNTLGTLYNSLGDYANASIYFKHSLDIRLQYNNDAEKVIGDSYTNLGNVKFDLGYFDEAISYYEKALAQRLKQKKMNTVMVAKNYNNIGYTYFQKGNIIEAKKNFVKGFEYAPLAVIYYNLGRINIIEKNFFAADTSLKKSLEIRLTHLGAKHFLTAESYAALADLQKAQGNYAKALYYFSQGLNSSLKSNETKFFGSSNPNIYDIISIKDFFSCLDGKAEMLLEMAKQDSALSRGLYAKHLLAFSIPLLSTIQKHYVIDESKLKLRELSDKTMNLGVEVCYELYQITNDNKYAEEAFLFSETKRSSVLNESKKQKAVMHELNIPDSVKILESALSRKLDLLYLSSEENGNDDNDNNTSIRENLIINTVSAYDSLLNFIRQNYPKYASLISYENVLTIEDLKNKSSKDDILAEYTITQENVFIFCVSGNSFNFIKKNKNGLFDKWNNDYKNSLKKIDKNVYSKTAKALYEELISPIEKELSNSSKLTIIPCPELASFPFEALISEKGDLLAQKVAVQYCSSSHFFGRRSINHNKFPYYFIGIAPSYNNKIYAPLKNDDEIKEISKIIRSSGLKDSLFYGGSKIKQQFFKSIGKSKILHIAAHSFADTTDEALSGIVFDSDNVLTGSEIIASEVNNDLVVLSSCEGGNGKKANGEGVLSLARSFIQSGANNLLVALWKVPDKQTKLFMTEFYKQLLRDDNYAYALSRTKRLMIKNKLYAFPNTWSAFVLMN